MKITISRSGFMHNRGQTCQACSSPARGVAFAVFTLTAGHMSHCNLLTPRSRAAAQPAKLINSVRLLMTPARTTPVPAHTCSKSKATTRVAMSTSRPARRSGQERREVADRNGEIEAADINPNRMWFFG